MRWKIVHGGVDFNRGRGEEFFLIIKTGYWEKGLVFDHHFYF